MMKAMEYTDMSGQDIDAILDSPEWVGQQKHDGTRVLLNLRTGEATTRKGTPLKFAAANQHMDSIRADLKRVGLLGIRNVYLDGELIVERGEYIVFEMVDPTDPTMTYLERLAWLSSLDLHGTRITVAKTWWGKDKAAALRMMRNAGVEGMMLKRADSLYEPGTRVKSGSKVKFVKTADVVVMERRKSPLSAKLGVLDSGRVVPVGSCSLIGKAAVEPGDVIEVNYLFWTGTNLYQPRMVRKRPDKTLLECPIDQLPEYSRRSV